MDCLCEIISTDRIANSFIKPVAGSYISAIVSDDNVTNQNFIRPVTFAAKHTLYLQSSVAYTINFFLSQLFMDQTKQNGSFFFKNLIN